MNYITISESGSAVYEISKSRFIAVIQRVDTEPEAIAFIQEIKKQHWEARHHCSAYIIGENTSAQKADDDGEPSGTAGKPILEVLKKNELKDIVIVVTRYFGGIKLGAGGLIRAYGKAASMAVSEAVIVAKVPYRRYFITIDYSMLGALENNIHMSEYIIEHKIFTDKITLHLLFKTDEENKALADIINWTNSQCLIEKEEQIYLEIPIKNNEDV